MVGGSFLEEKETVQERVDAKGRVNTTLAERNKDGLAEVKLSIIDLSNLETSAPDLTPLRRGPRRPRSAVRSSDRALQTDVLAPAQKKLLLSRLHIATNL